MKNNLFKILLRKNNLSITFISELTCKAWGEFWGETYNYIFSESKVQNITINLENCFYADPIALMSILLDLIKAKSVCSKNIVIVLPRLISNDVDKKNYVKGQFLKFLSTEGFLEIMLSNFIVRNNKAPIKRTQMEKYMSYNYKLPFSGSALVTARIYECYKEEEKEQIINNILDSFMFNFKGKVALNTYNQLYFYIHNIVNELIENIMRHAYEKKEKKLFALYIRNRKGSGKENANGFTSEEINKERENCPASDLQIYIDNSSFLEIFFVDIGVGLTSTLKEYYNKTDKNFVYPLRELFCKVLKDGIRKTTEKSLTPFGGLHFICRIIRENNGYIWCNEGKEWVSTSSTHLLKEGIKSSKVALTPNTQTKPTRGLNWCFKIPYNDLDNDKNKNLISFNFIGSPDEHPIYNIYCKKETCLKTSNLFCLDEKSGNFSVLNGNYKAWKTYKLNNIDSIDVNFNTQTLVWFPNYNYTKNQISSRLKEHLTDINKLSPSNIINSIIIGDIDCNELLSYFYAFNQNNSVLKDFTSVKKITLITNKWDIVVFQNTNGKLIRNPEEEYNYFQNTDYNNLSISVCAYARFIRVYDSYKLWTLIKKYKNEKLYINAKIKWGNQLIQGYLDLVRFHLYMDLYEIVINSLKRVSGILAEKNIEFKNVDLTVERLCQDLNSNISIYDEKIIPINVCGACVTGYTRDSYYSNSDFSLDLILFAHPSFKKDITNVAIVFIWPEDEFFNDVFLENEPYFRLGKTSFITRQEKENLINLENIYNNVTRNKLEMYNDFQIKSPKFIRYGHYKTDNHHYLIGFDFISYMKYSYHKKEGAFLFFLWKILYYLEGENLNRAYDLLQDSEWETSLKKCRYKKDSNHGEIVVYHSNTFTEYIMRLIKNILPDSINQRIIPITLLELQDKGCPITFPPFVIEQLEKVFNNKDARGILYVDSSFSTGRRMLEIENAFIAAGCKKVSFLSILDMRRLRNGDYKNNSYWKINLPRLDDDGQCVLCDALKKIDDYRKKTDSQVRKRLIDWQKNWSCMNINNSISEHGIEAIENLSCSFDEVSLHDSITLNMYMGETICESYNNDFVYSYITDKKTDLNMFIRMQLICTQIILFGNQHSRKLQLSLLSELINIMCKNDTINAYTSLAGLVIIQQKPEVIYELLNEILYINQNSKINAIRNKLLVSTNLDLVIAIGYFLKNNYLIEQLINSYPNKTNSNFITAINEHMLLDKDLKLLFRDFEGLYVNELGRRHNTNMQKLSSEHSKEYVDFEKRCNQVINDANTLAELITHFPYALVNSRGATGSIRNQLNANLFNLGVAIKKQQKEYLKEEKKFGDIGRFEVNDEVQKSIKECEKIFDEILNSYYICHNEQTIKYFEDLVNEYSTKYSKKIKLNVSSELSSEINKYYYWNSSIEKEFIYMLENVEHCNTPLDLNVDDTTVMTINIHFQINKILIKMISWSDKLADQVKNAFLSKNRLSKEQAKAFDVIFDFNNAPTKNNENDGEFLLEAQMSIPACYPQLKGE